MKITVYSLFAGFLVLIGVSLNSFFWALTFVFSGMTVFVLIFSYLQKRGLSWTAQARN